MNFKLNDMVECKMPREPGNYLCHFVGRITEVDDDKYQPYQITITKSFTGNIPRTDKICWPDIRDEQTFLSLYRKDKLDLI